MSTATPPPVTKDVAAVLERHRPEVRDRLLALRSLIFEVAATTAGVGPLMEMLKWGEPAYVTELTRSGSTIRLGVSQSDPPQCALHFNCNTTLLETFRTHFPNELSFVGRRSIVLPIGVPIPVVPLSVCIELALTYHRRKPRKTSWVGPGLPGPETGNGA